MTSENKKTPTDIIIIGGGVNGAAIARDAAGRDLSVILFEMNDLASATSSASTKLLHGGLRYLEYFDLKLVRHSLQERENLLFAMPHISKPLRFIIPLHPDLTFDSETPASKLLNFFMPWTKGKRPAWVIRFGLFIYDHLGGRKLLPPTSKISLQDTIEGKSLKSKFKTAYEYSDGWVDDARLVVLNARDAKLRGADIRTHTKVTNITQNNGIWKVQSENTITGKHYINYTKILINATGPWVYETRQLTSEKILSPKIKLVRGSHIVINRKFYHDKCYLFQGNDGRIIFAIPYENNYTLIGTTDQEQHSANDIPTCTKTEQAYLCKFANEFFDAPITEDDIKWRYSGVRPLYNDGQSSASAISRDYLLDLDTKNDAPLLSVYGGKITTHRILAEQVMEKLAPFFETSQKNWTSRVPLPGGAFKYEDTGKLITKLQENYSYLDIDWATRLIKHYGTDAFKILKGTKSTNDLGTMFASDLSEREVRWLMNHEFATSADDILWRRSKLGLLFSKDAAKTLQNWIDSNI